MTRVNPMTSSLSLSSQGCEAPTALGGERERQERGRRGEQEALVLEDNLHWLWDCGDRSNGMTLAEASL